ncbi:hypothetical protein [Flavobacterium sp.]|uniref:DUF6929 family protein n=1 Tax=Flavobacterium sp. TaxID=239 RepID=UPI0012170228|nr:hypothetical protein [Flavobacterium sp.]RZJ71285.1 MAG: hypothetical protein EOO49_11090 [Flavobacterium sp.]
MKRFSLELLYHIVGIGSASGLLFRDGSIFVASDNAGYLYEFHTADQKLDKTKLLERETLETIPKKQKPDFEALAEKDGKLHLFGSGSTEKRNVAAIVSVETKKVAHQDLSDLYADMRKVSGISTDNFNLEGAFASADAWFFIQRGNGNGANNGIFKVVGSWDKKPRINYFPIELPKLKHVTASFTDAILVANEIWFLATAEDTNSTYDDGEILGSLIGKMDFETLKITFTQQITEKHKFEGLTLYAKSKSEISFLLCEDNDTDGLEADIYQLTLPLP